MMLVMAAAHCKVCLVDDDESFRESVAGLFRSIGLQVRTFESAEAFLASEVSVCASCLVLDVNMPGMSGVELQRHLIDRGQRVQIVFVTARREPELRRQLLDRGAVACLIKPFPEGELLDAVSTAMMSQDQEQSLR
jgi:FixJ family two-component response regulator